MLYPSIDKLLNIVDSKPYSSLLEEDLSLNLIKR